MKAYGQRYFWGSTSAKHLTAELQPPQADKNVTLIAAVNPVVRNFNTPIFFLRRVVVHFNWSHIALCQQFQQNSTKMANQPDCFEMKTLSDDGSGFRLALKERCLIVTEAAEATINRLTAERTVMAQGAALSSEARAVGDITQEAVTASCRRRRNGRHDVLAQCRNDSRKRLYFPVVKYF